MSLIMRTYTKDGQTWLDLEVNEDGSGFVSIEEMSPSQGMEYGINISIKSMREFSDNLKAIVDLMESRENDS